MALTCLQIIQTACRRIGISPPNAAVTSTDKQIIQLLALCEEEGQEEVERYDWQTLQSEATFTTVAAQIQTTIAAVTTGFKSIVNDTIWNRTQRRPVYGPRSQQSWQQAKAMQLTGPFNTYRIMNDTIHFYPNPTAGQSCFFEYITKNWISTSTGTTSSIWVTDTDTPKLDDQIVTLGTIWRWKAAKGLDYAEDFAKYERRITDLMAKDGAKSRLDMSGASMDVIPAIFIPSGNWNV